jgi:dihydrofolate reductase
MGKLIISTHITVDGVIGPSPQDWAILEGEGERYKFDQLLAADAFLLGRKVYEGLASVWPTITDDTGFAERVNNIPKYVASRTLQEPLDWTTSLIKGDLSESVADLKRQHHGNPISFGCGELAYEFATQGLADEIHFWVQPSVWGSGERAFHGRQVRLQLITTNRVRLGHHPSLLPAGTRPAGQLGELTSQAQRASTTAVPTTHLGCVSTSVLVIAGVWLGGAFSRTQRGGVDSDGAVDAAGGTRVLLSRCGPR